MQSGFTPQILDFDMLLCCLAMLKVLLFRIKNTIFGLRYMLPFAVVACQHKHECVSSLALELSLRQLSGLEFEVNFKNISQSPCCFALPLQYPNYSALVFVVSDSGGGEFVFFYKGLEDVKPIYRGGFAQTTLQPGEAFKLNVNLDRTNWQWPDLISLDKRVQLKACYNYPKPAPSALNDTWYGSISSNFIDWQLPENERRIQFMKIYMPELPE